LKPRDRLNFSAIVDRAPLRLPDDARVAIWVIVNIENWDPESALPRTVLPPPGGQVHLPDIPNWTWQEYGMRVGYWRFMEVLERFGVKATLSINGSVIELYPRLAEAARDAGWEFLGHSYIQKPMHLLDDERAAIRKTVEVIRDFTGKAPRGWMGPGLTETNLTADILAEEGFEYVADWVADDQPFEVATTAGPLVSVPYTVELNDIPMMLIQHHKAAEFYDRTMDHFERLYRDGEKTARVMAIAVHPYISGVPHRIGYFEKVIEALHDRPGVVFWTGEQILDWYRSEAATS
jgi:peptidoglycan/xylan/chitin deacetylase (PgdA/CDA1 family)